MTQTDTLIYKVTTLALWQRAEAEGVLPKSPVDETDGYMHFSTAGQLRETLRRYFAGQGDLVLCVVPAAAVADALEWEPSRGGALFPHVYAPLPLSAVSEHHALAVNVDGSCALPEGIA
ncbi:MAG: DUF952 domain-containing protein [Alphaproteobacteria bacterium]|nr:DUF952 domain-containing protein [Alphaproteobacteria bacterium]